MLNILQIDHRDDDIAVITIDQPNSSANVLTEALWHELDEALTTHCHSEAILIQSAKPKITIAGADLKLLREATGPNDPKVRRFIELGLRVLDKLSNHPQPTCMLIDGILLGGGLEVALACDYRIAGTNPKIELGMPEIQLGLIPGWGGTQRLPRLIDSITASEMLYSGKSISAAVGLGLGLVDGLVESSLMIDSAVSVLRNDSQWKRRRVLMSSPINDEFDLVELPDTPAHAAMRECLEKGLRLPLNKGIAFETEQFMQLVGSDDSRQRIEAFFKK